MYKLNNILKYKKIKKFLKIYKNIHKYTCICIYKTIYNHAYP